MCTWRLSNHPLRSSDVLTRRRPSLTRLRQTMAVPRLSSHWTAITSARLTYNSKRKKNISKMEINQTIRICVLFPPIPSHSVLVIASLPPIHPSPPQSPLSRVVGTKTSRSKMLPDSVFFNTRLPSVNISLPNYLFCFKERIKTEKERSILLEILGRSRFPDSSERWQHSRFFLLSFVSFLFLASFLCVCVCVCVFNSTELIG